MCILMGKSLALLWTNFLLLQIFGNAKEKMDLSVVLKQVKCMWLQSGLLDLKNTEQLKFSLMVYFYAFLKVLHFSFFFGIFEIHQ